MSCQISDEEVRNYRTQGYVVFRRVVPPALLRDLRREAEVAREIAHRSDPDVQRLQPMEGRAELKVKPFQDLAELPELLDAIKCVVSDDAWITGPSRMGILFEPSRRPWATQWHRDFGPFQQRVDMDAFRRVRNHPGYFHQINCPLYAEGCTWYVPGSHVREDTPQEVHLTRDFPWKVGADQTEKSVEELEYFCAAYVRSMPGAVQLYLDAGDLALYRPHGYHLGSYVPYQKRATLHDNVWTPPYKASYDRWAAGETFTETPDETPKAAAPR